MSLQAEGTVKKSLMGMGTWTLVTDGQTYEIHKGAPDGLLVEGQKVRVNGEVRKDVMTMAMVGPVLDVKSFEPMG
ncbi:MULTISPECIES: hypothetical protein [unclassified Leptolyngbya]|uniref:hypothetical protein n=1 Tax=unclassified Leptolyngbya TaxID=2650499 RepID=UPI00168700CD|nr:MULTISPECIES: hypothetical protein [unclassified Leptolyngbya]MBD1912552.1 hypothetical protein [Leptolyngbya sp. FACHB-8]MBD2154905.1 hypothetical protein [Leptolyngbya sp. FACHB-16]